MSQCLDTTVIQTPSESSTSLADTSNGMKNGSKESTSYTPMIKFFIYWVAFVILALVPLLSSAPFMAVQPLDVHAPVTSVEDIFVMDVSYLIILEPTQTLSYS